MPENSVEIDVEADLVIRTIIGSRRSSGSPADPPAGAQPGPVVPGHAPSAGF